METKLIQRCNDEDYEAIWTIINDGARAYQGVIPADCLHEPYMARDALQREIASGVQFWAVTESGRLLGVMGSQDVVDVTLIRHAYVRTDCQKRGIGATLLTHLCAMAVHPVLVGTWADASWAIHFYEHHGFRVVSVAEKERLLRTYWNISRRQIETSVVLADGSWFERSSNLEMRSE